MVLQPALHKLEALRGHLCDYPNPPAARGLCHRAGQPDWHDLWRRRCHLPRLRHEGAQDLVHLRLHPVRRDDVCRVDQPCVRIVCDGHRLRHLAADRLVPLGTPAGDTFVPAGHAQEGLFRRVPRLGCRLVGARWRRRPAAVLRLDQLRHQLHRAGPLRAQVQRELVALDFRQHRELRLLVNPVGPDDDGRQHDRHARREPFAGRSAGGTSL